MDYQQLVLLLVVGVISLIKWFIDRADSVAKDRERRGTSKTSEAPRVPTFEPPASTMTDEEKAARRLMEALGIPFDEAPPAPPVPPQAAPPPPQAAPPPPPQAKWVPPAQIPAPKVRTPRENPVVVPKVEPPVQALDLVEAEAERQEEAFKEYASPFESTGEESFEEAFRMRKAPHFRFPSLKNKEELRRAILLKEILGKPKALQR